MISNDLSVSVTTCRCTSRRAEINRLRLPTSSNSISLSISELGAAKHYKLVSLCVSVGQGLYWVFHHEKLLSLVPVGEFCTHLPDDRRWNTSLVHESLRHCPKGSHNSATLSFTLFEKEVHPRFPVSLHIVFDKPGGSPTQAYAEEAGNPKDTEVAEGKAAPSHISFSDNTNYHCKWNSRFCCETWISCDIHSNCCEILIQFKILL